MATDVITKLQKDVQNTIEQLDLNETMITVAVSGGPDSLCMLHALHSISKNTGISLWGAHLDHKIRGRESKKDAEFVKTTFESIGIPYSMHSLDIPKISKKEGNSLELTARIHRHLFLSDVAQANNSSTTALGHNAGDQAETILMHLIRGTGLKGLVGMQQLSDRTISGIKMELFRPLLFTSRKDIVDYCYEAHLTPRTDATNLSMKHSRNGVRENLIPALKIHNPRIESSLLRLSKSASRDIRFIDDYTETAYLEATNIADGVVSIRKDALKNMPEAIKHRVFKKAASLLLRGNLELTMAHIDSIAILADGQSGNSINLPGGTTVTNSYSEVIFHRSNHDANPLPKIPDITKLSIPGSADIPGWKIKTYVKLVPDTKTILNTDNHSAWLPYDPLVESITIRTRKPGDRFQPKGMAEGKKLQDFMVDAKIPRDERDGIPIVEINHLNTTKIIWVVGWRLSEWANVKSGQMGVFIKFSKTNNIG